MAPWVFFLPIDPLLPSDRSIGWTQIPEPNIYLLQENPNDNHELTKSLTKLRILTNIHDVKFSLN